MGIKKLFRKLFICGYWDIVVADSIDNLKTNKVKRINSSIFEWYADPFLLIANGKTIVFCERKKISKRNGDICTFTLENGKTIKRRLIKEPFHLSFPNIFKLNEVYYIMPESSRGNTLRLYEYNPSQNDATLNKILKDDCALVDSVVNSCSDGLHIFSYDSRDNVLIDYLLSSKMELVEQHRAIDIEKTLRPAGNPIDNIFFFQDCSSVYGESIIAAKLSGELSFSNVENDYLNQIEVYCASNNYSRYHTLNFDLNSKAFVFDVYKERVNLLKPWLMLWRVICGNN